MEWDFVSSRKARIEQGRQDWQAGWLPQGPGDEDDFIPLPERPPVPGGVLSGNRLRYFDSHPAARGYVLDDQGAVRKHMLVMVDGRPIRDRARLSDTWQTPQRASASGILRAVCGNRLT